MINYGIESLNYRNDELLSKGNVFLNGRLNIYNALFRKEDFMGNKKGEILKRCPYLYDIDGGTSKLIFSLKDRNFINLRNLLGSYLEINRIRKDTFYEWIRKKIYPLPLVRIVCYLSDKDFLKMLDNQSITDFCQQSKIRFKLTVNYLYSDFMAYFVGLHIGDGTLNNERWKIVDGDKYLDNLNYSYKFLSKIRRKLVNIFSINIRDSYKIKNKNAYELIISNKWFCRYLNFAYDLEYNQKRNPFISSMLKNRKRFVLRGLFDTDGSIKDYRISIGTKYKSLYNEIRKILKQYKIEYREKKNNIQRKNVVYIIEIKKEFIKNFILIIGFSHPRKILEIKKYLLTNSASRDFISYDRKYKPKILESEFVELCTYLRPIKNAGKIRFISHFNKLDNESKNNILNNFIKNFGITKRPNKKGYVYSYDVERIFTNYCTYKRRRNSTKEKEISDIMINLEKIWN